jgi:FMN reductase
VCKNLGARVKLFDGQFISRLPLYIPGPAEARNPNETFFVDAIRSCDGIIIGSPEYHGTLSAAIKNALDLLEDTALDPRPYLDGRAFGCITTAYGWQASGTTLGSLRVIAHALRAWPTPYGSALNSSIPLFAKDGGCIDAKVLAQLTTVASQVIEFARCRNAGLSAIEGSAST